MSNEKDLETQVITWLNEWLKGNYKIKLKYADKAKKICDIINNIKPEPSIPVAELREYLLSRRRSILDDRINEDIDECTTGMFLAFGEILTSEKFCALSPKELFEITSKDEQDLLARFCKEGGNDKST